MENKEFKNTEHPIKVGGKDATGHTAKHIDANNPPKQPAKTDAPAGTPPKGDK